MSALLKASLKYLLATSSVFFLLGLSAFCFRLYANKQKVLGMKIEITENQELNVVPTQKTFWEEFLAENPDYLPGWWEIGRLDKVKEINPNFSGFHP